MKLDKLDKILNFVSHKYPHRPASIEYYPKKKKVIVEISEVESWEEARWINAESAAQS